MSVASFHKTVNASNYVKVAEADGGWIHLREKWQRRTLCGKNNAEIIYEKGGQETDEPADCYLCHGELLQDLMRIRDGLFGYEQ